MDCFCVLFLPSFDADIASYYLLLRCQRENGRKKCGLRGLIVRQWTHFNPLHNGEEEEDGEQSAREINRRVIADRQKRLSVMSKCGGNGGGDEDDDDDDIGRMPVQIEGSGRGRDGNTIDQLFPPHDPQ